MAQATGSVESLTISYIFCRLSKSCKILFQDGNILYEGISLKFGETFVIIKIEK